MQWVICTNCLLQWEIQRSEGGEDAGQVTDPMQAIRRKYRIIEVWKINPLMK